MASSPVRRRSRAGTGSHVTVTSPLPPPRNARTPIGAGGAWSRPLGGAHAASSTTDAALAHFPEPKVLRDRLLTERACLHLRCSS